MDLRQEEIIRLLFHDSGVAGHPSRLARLRKRDDVSGITRWQAWDAMVAYIQEAEAEKERNHG